MKRLAGRGLAVLLSFHGTIAHLRALVPTRTPLEALSFMLTDDPNHQTLARPDARP